MERGSCGSQLGLNTLASVGCAPPRRAAQSAPRPRRRLPARPWAGRRRLRRRGTTRLPPGYCVVTIEPLRTYATSHPVTPLSQIVLLCYPRQVAALPAPTRPDNVERHPSKDTPRRRPTVASTGGLPTLNPIDVAYARRSAQTMFESTRIDYLQQHSVKAHRCARRDPAITGVKYFKANPCPDDGGFASRS